MLKEISYLFYRVYLEALIVTIGSIIVGYLVAGMPANIPYLKLIPTFLIALPVYITRSPNLPKPWGHDSTSIHKIDAIIIKFMYFVGITWLSWDIFKGII